MQKTFKLTFEPAEWGAFFSRQKDEREGGRFSLCQLPVTIMFPAVQLTSTFTLTAFVKDQKTKGDVHFGTEPSFVGGAFRVVHPRLRQFAAVSRMISSRLSQAFHTAFPEFSVGNDIWVRCQILS